MSKSIGFLIIFLVVSVAAIYYYLTTPSPTVPVIPLPLPMLPQKPIPKEQVLTNLNYVGSTDPEQNLDLYIPAVENYPIMIFVHGGGWSEGSKEMYVYVGKFFQSRGIGCAVINYRLSPRVKFPSHAQDTAKAIAWTYKNIASHGGNPNKLYLSGHSAGGHLCSLVALDGSHLTAEGSDPKIIKGVISVSAPYSIKGNVDIAGLGHVFSECDKAKASPINFIKPNPPFIIFYAESDIITLPRQAIKFNDAMMRAGNRTKLIMYGNQTHSSIVENLFAPGIYENEIINFVKQ